MNLLNFTFGQQFSVFLTCRCFIKIMNAINIFCIYCVEDFEDEEEESKADFDQESTEMSEEGEWLSLK